MIEGITTIKDQSSVTADLFRYRALLKISGAVGAQPTLDAVLHSLTDLLSNVVRFESVHLFLFDASGERLTLRAFEHGFHDPGVEIGMEITYAGKAVGRALEEQVPVFVPDVNQELTKYPELASRMRDANVESAYIFPVST